MNILKTWFKILIAIVFISINMLSQDLPHSVGLAPLQDFAKSPVMAGFDASIGNRYFAQTSSSPTFQFGKSFTESCTITNVGAPFTITFPGGLMIRNGVVFTWNQSSPYQLWTIDTVSGNHTLYFNITGVPFANLTGMCWDGTNVYGLSTSLTQTQMFTINMTTGVCTPIGVASSVCDGGIILLGSRGAQYSLFVLDIVTDSLFRVNKTTGVFTRVGPLGINLNFGQDGCVDPFDNTFYVIAYSTGSELRKVDTVTGNLGPVLCTYTAQATGMTLRDLPPLPPGPPTNTFCRSNLNKPINDSSILVDSVQVLLGNNIFVSDLNVRIDSVLHTWDSELAFYLQKGLIGVKIIDHVGGSGDNFIQTVLNDSSAVPVSSGSAPFTGTFKPSNPLLPFNYIPSDGYWKLLITDTAGGETGILMKWCLVIQYYYVAGGIQTMEIPNYYFLNQNYPNPFNPVTNIKFGIPESGNVRLAVYDILGREVTTLINEHKNPGTYEVKFDASQLASGIYFYSLQTDRVTETKRMLLVK
ncbi:MAG: T9SS type A sorting domain-containing protein [Ignavibacteria bacterium]|nr:T9SS type A sorting domain-containing protein [Ignavibacteria bacterium]